MGKLLKILLWLVIALAVLITIAAVVLPMVVDPNDYKDDIASAVQKQTGRTLAIEGDIELSVFPWLGLDIGPTQLSNAAGFDEPFMARMQSVQVRVKLLPLMRKQVEIDQVQLIGLQLNLAKDAQGRSNWDDLTAAPDKVAEPRENTSSSDSTGSSLDSLTIGGIELTDAQINWYDAGTDSRQVINELSLVTGAIISGEVFDLDLNMLLSSTQPPMQARVMLHGAVLLAEELDAVSISGAELQLKATGDSLPNGELNATLNTDISLGMEAQTLLLPNLTLETLGMVIRGSVNGVAISSDSPRFNGSLTIDEFSPRDLLTTLGETPPEMADATALDKASAMLVWDATLQSLTVTTLTAHLDASTLNGNLKVNNFSAPAIGFDIALDQINLDRYLPPESEQDKDAESGKADAGQGGKGGKGKAQADALPLEPLRQLDLDGMIRIGTLKAFKLRSSDIEIRISADNGVLKISPFTANLYEGAVDLDVQLDARNDTPKISVKEVLKGVQAGPLLKDLTGEDTVLGTANVKVDLSGTGTDVDAIIKTLNGKAKFSFKDGAINGVNLAALIQDAQAIIKEQPATKQEQPNRTDFALLKGSALIKDGVIKNDDLKMKSPLLRITGAGQASLPAETIDYTLTTKIVGSLEGQGGKGSSKLEGITIPVHVSGTFSSPIYSPDLGAVMSDAARKEVDKRIKKEKKKLQKKLGEKVPDGLLKELLD